MACEAQKTAFDNKFAQIQQALKEEIAAIAHDTESKTEQLSDEFKDNNDLSQGVGATAGALAGGALGGAPGAAAGAMVGKIVGALFVVDIREETVQFALDLPAIAMRDTEWSLDLPEVTTKDTDIVFKVPTLVMKTIEGPPVPESVTEMRTECVKLPFGAGKICTDIPHTTVRWRKTYIDVPTWENRDQRVVIGIPSITMTTRKMSMSLPEITMEQREISFSVPSVSIRFAKDAGRALADRARELANDSATLLAQKQAAFKDRMRQELVGPANAMFDCHRSSLQEKRTLVSTLFSQQLDTIANSIISMTNNKVPESDPQLVAVRAGAAELMAQRNRQLKQFDDATAKLDESAKKAIDQFMA